MRLLLKRTTQWVLLIAMSPVAALAGFGRFEAVYSFFAHTLALLPGILGVFMRAAYYRLTLTACAADVTIGFGTYFAHPEASVGTHVSVGAYCVIGRTRIGERTQVASHVQIVSGRHQHVRGAGGRVEEGSYRQVVVGPDCWIGSGAILMANVGARVTIGAGAVVTKEFPEGVVAAGNPARVLTGC
jgi:acetyltransferase-like isoleucine patch superfamily enzyme